MDLGFEIQKTNVGIKISILEYHMCQFWGKTDNFDFFGRNLPKNGFWDRNFKTLSPDLESAPPRYHVCQFSVKTDNFDFFGLNLGKLSNYVQYFGSNNVERAGWRAKWAGWRWMELGGGWNELDGVDCSWVEVGARGSNTRLFNSARLFHEAIQENYWKS